ncbi:Glutamate decarboxylase [Corynebacterium heidelbergense]|nr:Glutamate decarboxylase [Corynebacterium heidelbergense]
MAARHGSRLPLDKFEIPSGETDPQTAYQLVHDVAMLDGNARLNLATFVSTWMGDRARRLYLETDGENMIDKNEYPQTAEIGTRRYKLQSLRSGTPLRADLNGAPSP